MRPPKWYRATVPRDKETQLKELIRRQALAYRQWGRYYLGFDEPLNPYLAATESECREAGGRFSAAKNQIESLLIPNYGDMGMQERIDWEIVTTLDRTYITHRRLIPTEMALDLDRSYMPSELEEQLELWKKHVSRMQSGDYAGYLLANYLYVQSIRAFGIWLENQAIVDALLRSESVKHQRLAKWLGADEIRQLLPPKLYPPPKWLDWRDSPRPIRDEEEASEVLYEYFTETYALNWKLNVELSRFTTPRHYVYQRNFWKPPLPIPHPHPVISDDELGWINVAFEWIEECIEKEMGIFML